MYQVVLVLVLVVVILVEISKICQPLQNWLSPKSWILQRPILLEQIFLFVKPKKLSYI